MLSVGGSQPLFSAFKYSTANVCLIIQIILRITTIAYCHGCCNLHVIPHLLPPVLCSSVSIEDTWAEFTAWSRTINTLLWKIDTPTLFLCSQQLPIKSQPFKLCMAFLQLSACTISMHECVGVSGGALKALVLQQWGCHFPSWWHCIQREREGGSGRGWLSLTDITLH